MTPEGHHCSPAHTLDVQPGRSRQREAEVPVQSQVFWALEEMLHDGVLARHPLEVCAPLENRFCPQEVFSADRAHASSAEPKSGPKYKVGTIVSDFEDGEWVDGTVIDFQEGAYVVQWDDEVEYEYYDSHDAEDMQELKQMARDGKGDDDAPPEWFFAQNDLWKIGTRVAVREDDILWYGKIDGFSDGAYSIAWDNGEQEYLDNFDLVNRMVANAAEFPKPGMSVAGKFFLSLFMISICAVGSVYGYKYYQKTQTQTRFDLEMDEEGGFRDQPDNLPKII